MTRGLVVEVLLFVILSSYANGINKAESISLVEKLSRNEYGKRTGFFFQPGYLYDTPSEPFPCATEDMQSKDIPTSVHAMRPGDVKCVAAMGDGMTAGLGAHAITPIGLLLEKRGVAWPIGGNEQFESLLSLPNILRKYNPALKGYSTGTTLEFPDGQNATHNRLNVAKSGDRSYNIIDQANLLLSRMKNEEWCDWDNDWKLITLFIGGGDLCLFCKDANPVDPAQYLEYVRTALDRLIDSNLPRTLINLVPTFDVREVSKLSQAGLTCELFLKELCPCAAFPTIEQVKILDKWIPQYRQDLIDLISSGRYDIRDDFTVVVQPFLAGTQIPETESGHVDLHYFAPDCFHLSGKGHSVAALGLWNNMFEPIGRKQSSVHSGEQLKCPSREHPFIFTSRNSEHR